MKTNYLLYKNLGETPLEALERLRTEENIASDIPMTYAGRLDPAAEGLLIILTGEECKKKELYTGLGKTYVAEIVFGVSTDTYDLLGIPNAASCNVEHDADLPAAVSAYLDSHLGTFIQKYPKYSSKTLFQDLAEAPTHEVTLHSYSDLKILNLPREEVIDRVEKVTSLVKGDFRQSEILESWKAIQNELPENLSVLKLTIEVGSGFYVRQLAEDLGRELGTGACLYSLVRTEIRK